MEHFFLFFLTGMVMAISPLVLYFFGLTVFHLWIIFDLLLLLILGRVWKREISQEIFIDPQAFKFKEGQYRYIVKSFKILIKSKFAEFDKKNQKVKKVLLSGPGNSYQLFLTESGTCMIADLKRVIDLCCVASNGTLSKEIICAYFGAAWKECWNADKYSHLLSSAEHGAQIDLRVMTDYVYQYPTEE